MDRFPDVRVGPDLAGAPLLPEVGWVVRSGTSSNPTGMEFPAVMKSVFPDQSVATTAFPRLMASMRWSPSPSERWRESSTSQLAYRPRTSG